MAADGPGHDSVPARAEVTLRSRALAAPHRIFESYSRAPPSAVRRPVRHVRCQSLNTPAHIGGFFVLLHILLLVRTRPAGHDARVAQFHVDSAFCELQCSSDWVDSRCDGPLALVHARVQPGVRMQLEHKVAKLIHKLLNKFQVRADQTRINSRLQAPWVTDRREVRSVKHMPCRARNGVKTPRRLSWCGTYRQKLFNTGVRIGASKSYAAGQRSHTKTHRSRQTCRSQVSGHADCRALRPRASVRAAIARQSGHKPTSSIG